ncbi:MAG: methyltransferase [Verrucomicrobia bacterium]|nr:methyltransferase [Verrucomicrobiota bacterium]
MIIHKLIAHHFKHKDDAEFYRLQAEDAIRWIEAHGVRFDGETKVLDLGCGHGVFGGEIAKRGSQVVFADEANFLLEENRSLPFRQINIDQEDPARLGEYDVVVCSNVFEHLAKPEQFIAAVPRLLAPDGLLYLSWTNWLSPWGGHEFSPFHFLGPHWGPAAYDRVIGKIRKHTPYQNLFPTFLGRTLRLIRRAPDLKIVQAAPRYYPEAAFVMRIPVIREFLAWNCALLLRKFPPRR